MAWFGRSSGPEEPDPDEQAQQAVSELLDQRHPRASMSDGDRMVMVPGKALENIAFAMERVDTDITTPVSIEADVISLEELVSLVQNLRMGPSLAVHVVNTAMRIMSARYPTELVGTPLPPWFDLRELHPVTISGQQHEIAKAIFNRRITSAADLTEDDVAAELEPLDVAGQMQVFVTLFYMFGTKVGAIKHRTGIE
jgi:hypothetical protein